MSDELHTAETWTARPRSPLGPRVGPGDKIGRFSVLSEVGAGGMGRIYEAYDPNLDRRVALKLLIESGEPEHWQRLRLEAQALAKLDHPNVVTVHDVGMHEGALFVAMEFVSGGTLKDWLANNAVGSRAGRFEEAVRLLLDAGRGLVAAHEAGLVHRDVKPSNILIGEDGRARVADFGIARVLESTTSQLRESMVSGDAVLATEESGRALTRTGALIGTPAYMAPEQFGGRVKPTADQFAYCVMAWEVLFGVRPFEGADVRARLTSIRKGELRKPEGVAVNAKVEALLTQGLRHRPSSRHRGLHRLVRELARETGQGPRGPRRFVRRWAFPVAIIGILVVAAAYRVGQEQQLCTGSAEAWNEVWDETRRESTRTAVLASEIEFAPGAWGRLEGALDAYGESWEAAHSDACQATQVRAEQPPTRMEERFACLEGAKRSVNALLEVVSSGDPGVLANEAGLLAGLANIEDCAEVRSLPTPAEQLTLERVAQAAAERSAGHPRMALEIVEPLAQRLDDTTSTVVRARVLLEYGRGLGNNHPRRAIEILEESYSMAHAAGERPGAGAAARELAQQHIRLQDKPDLIRDWLHLAKSESRQASSVERSELFWVEGELLALSGRDAEATSAFEQGVAVVAQDEAQLPSALRRLAVHLAEIDPDRSLDVAADALHRFELNFGPGHPGLAAFEETLAAGLAMHGRLDEAERLAERALNRVSTTWGAGSTATSRYRVRLAMIRCTHRDWGEDGRKSAERAVSLHPTTSLSPARYEALLALDSCVRSRDAERTTEVSEQILSISKELYGDDDFRTTRVRTMHAAALLQTSRVRAARTELRSARTRAHESAPGWKGRDAVQLHAILARLSSDLRVGTTLEEQGKASLAIARTPGSPAALPPNLNSELCSSKRVIGDLEGALEHCLAALHEGHAETRPFDYARLEYETTGVLNELSRHRDALTHAKIAEKTFLEYCGTDSYYGALARLELAAAHEGVGENIAARRYFERSFELFQALEGTNRPQLEAGAGVARTMAVDGDWSDAIALLDDLGKLVDQRIPSDRGRLSESRGFVLHLRDREQGVAEYARALADYRFSHYTPGVRRVCRTAPIDLKGCPEAKNQRR